MYHNLSEPSADICLVGDLQYKASLKKTSLKKFGRIRLIGLIVLTQGFLCSFSFMAFTIPNTSKAW
jgi:hypothetical protein